MLPLILASFLSRGFPTAFLLPLVGIQVTSNPAFLPHRTLCAHCSQACQPLGLSMPLGYLLLKIHKFIHHLMHTQLGHEGKGRFHRWMSLQIRATTGTAGCATIEATSQSQTMPSVIWPCSCVHLSWKPVPFNEWHDLGTSVHQYIVRRDSPSAGQRPRRCTT